MAEQKGRVAKKGAGRRVHFFGEQPEFTRGRLDLFKDRPGTIRMPLHRQYRREPEGAGHECTLGLARRQTQRRGDLLGIEPEHEASAAQHDGLAIKRPSKPRVRRRNALTCKRVQVVGSSFGGWTLFSTVTKTGTGLIVVKTTKEPRPMPKFRRQPAPAYNENDNPIDIAQRDDAATTLLQGRALDVRRVMRTPAGGILIEWRRTPTEAERAVADQLVSGAAHAHALWLVQVHRHGAQRGNPRGGGQVNPDDGRAFPAGIGQEGQGVRLQLQAAA